MAQLVTRIDDELVSDVDNLVLAGVVDSRSHAVRLALRRLVDEHRRRDIANAIVTGYSAHPQVDSEAGWPDEATIRMIAEEPW